MPHMLINYAKFARSFFSLIAVIIVFSSSQTVEAQVDGLTLRSPPMTHAFIDAGDFLVGIGLSSTKVENPGYRVADVIPETVTTSQKFAFLAVGLTDWLAIGVSNNPTEIEITGIKADTSTKVDTTLKSYRTYYYIIPTVYQWQKSRIAFIWGKGRATIEENETLERKRQDYNIGTTGLFGEFFLGESFSIVPWFSWPYLLFDINPPSVAEVQTPDYGFDGIIHIGEAKLSLSLIFQALETVDKSETDEDLKKEDSDEEKKTSQESYSVSLSYVF